MPEWLSIPAFLAFNANLLLIFVVSLVLITACIKLIINKDLVKSIMIMSIFSVFISILYLLMDAPDVAMTETALGVCLSTCVLLNIVKYTGHNNEKKKKVNILLATILCLLFFACMSWAVLDLPVFGAESSPVQNHLTEYYIKNTEKDIGIVSMVAAILASYRGFDTLGETIVILIAGIGVIAIMSREKQKDETTKI